jgi:hypothetical protein
MEILEAKQPRSLNLDYQCELLNEVQSGSTSISFRESKCIPSNDVVQDLISYLDQIISKNKLSKRDLGILLEIQFILVSSMIVGILPYQLFQLKQKDFLNLERLYYQDTEIKIIGNCTYLIELVNKMPDKNQNENYPILSHITQSNLYDSVNLFLVMNGIESNLTEDKLKIIFGRYHYLRQGTTEKVRKFLCKYIKASDHIDLLYKLKLIANYLPRI